jgi:hypothetical protein
MPGLFIYGGAVATRELLIVIRIHMKSSDLLLLVSCIVRSLTLPHSQERHARNDRQASSAYHPYSTLVPMAGYRDIDENQPVPCLVGIYCRYCAHNPTVGLHIVVLITTVARHLLVVSLDGHLRFAPIIGDGTHTITEVPAYGDTEDTDSIPV